MSKRRALLESKSETFRWQYGRKKQPGHDPNDRGYDRALERQIRHMDPRELDEFLRGEGEEALPESSE